MVIFLIFWFGYAIYGVVVAKVLGARSHLC